MKPGTRYGRPDKRPPLPPELRAMLDRMRQEREPSPLQRITRELESVTEYRSARSSFASVWHANRATLAPLLVALCALVAACGGNDGQRDELTFRDKAAFETYIAGYLAVERVSCRKTAETAARCGTPSGDEYVVLCETVTDEGGQNCTVSRNEDAD